MVSQDHVSSQICCTLYIIWIIFSKTAANAAAQSQSFNQGGGFGGPGGYGHGGYGHGGYGGPGGFHG